MSYIFNNQIKYSDSPNLDAFGRLRVSNITSLLEVSHVHDKRPYIIDEVTGGTVTSTWDSSNSQVIMTSSGSNGYVIRQTLNTAVYQPGKSQIIECSFSNFGLESNVIKRVGYFNSSSGSTYSDNLDGFFLESNGVNNIISFQIWKSGSQTFSSDTSSWDSSEINPSSIDWSKTQLMLCDFQWLGVGRVRFGMVFNGLTYYFTESTGANNQSTVYMSTPNKPIRYEIRSTTVGSSGSFNQICSQVSMEGSLNSLQIPIGIVGNLSETTLSTQNTKYALLGVRMNSGYEDISLILKDVRVVNTSNQNYYCTLEIDPPINGSYTFSASSQPEVMKSFGDGSTNTITGNSVVVASFVGLKGDTSSSSFEGIDSQVLPGKKLSGEGQELWLCVTPLGNNAKFYSSMNLIYRK